MIFFDTETCGLHGMPVLIQWAEDDGPVQMHNIWKLPAIETLRLIEHFCDNTVVGFNLAFDWFQLCKIYTTLSMCRDLDEQPQYMIDEIAINEKEARDGVCVKPANAFDIMLHARKGPYQSTMEREDIRIRRVPAVLAGLLASELEKRIPLKDIYFARRKDKGAEKWSVRESKDRDTGLSNPNFRDIVVSFAPSSALKALAVDALGIKAEDTLIFTDVSVDKAFNPICYGYAPFALAGVIGSRVVDGKEIRVVNPVGPDNWRGTWPQVIRHHFNHWAFNSLAQTYAEKDVIYTRELYKFFGSPQPGDDNSILACAVAANRWRGYAIDAPYLTQLKEQAIVKSKSAPRAPAQVKKYLEEVMDETEKLALAMTTKKVILEEISKWDGDEDEDEDIVTEQIATWGSHPAAKRAAEVLAARKASKQVEIYDKLLMAGRFHASFVVTGTLSDRMAGADKLNPQGINKTDEIRKGFTLAHSGMELDGGDFDGFEVTIAIAAYKDPKLEAEVKSGLKIHALFGRHFFKPMTYDEIRASEGTADDKYTKSKSGFFALIFGGTEYTLQTKIGVSEENATEGYASFLREYKEIAKSRQRIADMFCSMRQPGGIGSKVVWHEPADYIESLLGFRRYFTLENRVCKALFELAQNPPDDWKKLKIKVIRRDRMQTVTGAVQSALFGAAFGIQAANMRAAANHEIQSTGATITKRMQTNIWTVQPPGINKWYVQPLNIHDEIECPVLPEVRDKVKEIVEATIESFKSVVPLIKMKWYQKMGSWAG